MCTFGEACAGILASEIRFLLPSVGPKVGGGEARSGSYDALSVLPLQKIRRAKQK